MSDDIYYAIGDVHGEIDKLDLLLEYIRDDAAHMGMAYKIVFLGDLVDRGPNSRAVIERAMAATKSGEAQTIKGNHEELMLHAYDQTESIGTYFWAENGGDETVASYVQVNGRHDDWRNAIDKAHMSWLRSLPVTITVPERRLVFVHAGIDPKTYPNCSDELRMWTRSQKFYNPQLWPDRPEVNDICVIHGHTPVPEPYLHDRRINVDTGACFGGVLTAVVLAPKRRPRFLRAH